jgi:hypothetical protein
MIQLLRKQFAAIKAIKRIQAMQMLQFVTIFSFSFLGLVAFLLLLTIPAFAQNPSNKAASKEEFLASKDSSKIAKDSLKKIALNKQKDIETTVNYKAVDSIRFNVASKMIYMFGSSNVGYGKITLDAEQIDMNWQTNLIVARSRYDTTAKKIIGKPVFTDQGTKYNIDAMTYNFKTRKGIIQGIRTKQDEGYVVGSRVKKTPDNAMFIGNGLYTTCDHPEPHFGIRSRKMKVIPNKVTVSGLFNLEIAGVPTPLGFLFGMFPQPNRRRSGLIFPQYGETQTNGFFLQGGGVYLALSNYVDVALQTEIHSKGRWGLTGASKYLKKYKYSGNVNVTFLQTLTEIDGSTTKNVENNFNVTWSHTPQTRGTSRFSANANFGTNNASRKMMLPNGNANSFLSSSLRSNLSYSKTLLNNAVTLSSTLSHDQNLISKIITITPNVNMAVNRIYPFKSKLNPNSKSLFRQLNIAYTGTAQTAFTNLRLANPYVANSKADTMSFAPENFEKMLKQAQTTVKHNIPISTSTTVAKYFNINFSGNYSESWAFERYYARNNPTAIPTDSNLNTYRTNKGGLAIDTISGLSRFYDYNLSMGLQTRLYATYFFKGRVEALRHTMAPNISYNYSPDFSGREYGFFQQVPVDSAGTKYTNKSIFPSYAGSPRQGVNNSIAFSLSNLIEIKVKSNNDSIKTAKKIAIFDDISIGSGYNFAADSMRLGNFSIGARTSIAKQITINISGNLDPYAYIEYQKPPISKSTEPVDLPTYMVKNPTVIYRSRYYAWEKGQGIGSLTNLGIQLSTSLNRKAANKEHKAKTPDEQAEVDFINRNKHLYIDFDIPWNLVLSYNVNYSRAGFAKANITQVFSFNGDVSLTKKWKVTFNSGWDFQASTLSFTQFAIARDMHCWQMNVTWIPFGQRAGFTFDLNVKSSILRDLKLSRRNNWYYR